MSRMSNNPTEFHEHQSNFTPTWSCIWGHYGTCWPDFSSIPSPYKMQRCGGIMIIFTKTKWSFHFQHQGLLATPAWVLISDTPIFIGQSIWHSIRKEVWMSFKHWISCAPLLLHSYLFVLCLMEFTLISKSSYCGGDETFADKDLKQYSGFQQYTDMFL